eukprot:jgi/Mesvir1/26336/Mv22513-RA.2
MSARQRIFRRHIKASSQALVLERIESLILSFLEELFVHERISKLALVSRSEANYTDTGQGQRRHGSQRTLVSLLSKKGSISYVRIWLILNLVYELVAEGKHSTQRDMYYCLVGRWFKTPAQVNNSIQDAVALLQCSRNCLGITASPKGLLAGRLKVKEGATWHDYSHVSRLGRSIPGEGDVRTIMSLQMQSDACCVLVVEKDAVFQRLVEDKFHNSLPSILVTAKGFPDLATRALLARIHALFPHLPLLALVDWNPFGVSIMTTYRYGSRRMLESYQYAVPVRWLGMRYGDTADLPADVFQPMGERDRAQLRSLLSCTAWQDDSPVSLAMVEELEHMQREQSKVEIEALYTRGVGFLAERIAQKIVRQDFL